MKFVGSQILKDILNLQNFLRHKFNLWAGNDSCVQEIRKTFKENIFQDIKRYITQKILRKT